MGTVMGTPSKIGADLFPNQKRSGLLGSERFLLCGVED